MIPELQEEQATLYALGLLEADEADAVERGLAANPELRELVRELRDSASSLALLTDKAHAGPPSGLKANVLQAIKAEHPLAAVPPQAAPAAIVRPRFAWVPWAVAASLLGCLYWLGTRFSEEQSLRKQWEGTAKFLQQTKPVEQPPMDALAKVAFCELEPTPEPTKQPRAAVLWDAANRRGVLRVNKLPPPAAGKDYELWTVEDGRKDPVAAGLVRVGADGSGTIPFQPAERGGSQVVAVAISLEQAGGSPVAKGPILFLGKF